MSWWKMVRVGDIVRFWDLLLPFMARVVDNVESLHLPRATCWIMTHATLFEFCTVPWDEELICAKSGSQNCWWIKRKISSKIPLNWSIRNCLQGGFSFASLAMNGIQCQDQPTVKKLLQEMENGWFPFFEEDNKNHTTCLHHHYFSMDSKRSEIVLPKSRDFHGNPSIKSIKNVTTNYPAKKHRGC